MTSESGFECQLTHLGGPCDPVPRHRQHVPRYFVNGRHLYACGAHAAARAAMGPGCPFKPWLPVPARKEG